MQHGSAELDRTQSTRKPEIDSDLMVEIGMLESLVADLLDLQQPEASPCSARRNCS